MDSLGASGASAEPPHAAWVKLETVCAPSHPGGRSGLLPELPEQARSGRARLTRRAIAAFIDESQVDITRRDAANAQDSDHEASSGQGPRRRATLDWQPRVVRKLGRAGIPGGFRNGGVRWPATIVPRRETSEAGRPNAISGPSDGRLDPSAAAAGHRVPAGREPGAPRTPRHGAPAVHGRRAPAPGREGSGPRPDHAARMIAAKYDGSETRRPPGRPPTASDVTEQLLTMARESPSWGYTRLRVNGDDKRTRGRWHTRGATASFMSAASCFLGRSRVCQARAMPWGRSPVPWRSSCRRSRRPTAIVRRDLDPLGEGE